MESVRLNHSPTPLNKTKEVKKIDIKLVTIDGSTQKSGVAYFVNGKYQTHKLLDYSKDKKMDSRFESMAKGLWLTLNEFNPDIIYIEETYTARNPQTTKFLTRLQGVVYAWCIKNSCEFHTILPTQWRKVLSFKQSRGTKRDELKKQSIQYIQEKYNLTITDDEADALCIADAVIKIYGENHE